MGRHSLSTLNRKWKDKPIAILSSVMKLVYQLSINEIAYGENYHYFGDIFGNFLTPCLISLILKLLKGDKSISMCFH